MPIEGSIGGSASSDPARRKTLMTPPRTHCGPCARHLDWTVAPQIVAMLFIGVEGAQPARAFAWFAIVPLRLAAALFDGPIQREGMSSGMARRR
jgi:hypothetical protein